MEYVIFVLVYGSAQIDSMQPFIALLTQLHLVILNHYFIELWPIRKFIDAHTLQNENKKIRQKKRMKQTKTKKENKIIELIIRKCYWTWMAITLSSINHPISSISSQNAYEHALISVSFYLGYGKIIVLNANKSQQFYEISHK